MIDIDSCRNDTKRLAEQLYKAYTANSNNLNYQGLPCPLWEDLPATVRSHWCAVAEEAAFYFSTLGE